MSIPVQRLNTFQACQKVKAETGFRSGLEVVIVESLDSQNCPYLYEAVQIPYDNPSIYLPDFVLEAQAIVVEGKGEFKTEDRRKILLVKRQYPDLDLRIVFSHSATRIGKRSKTTYAMWCEKQGIPYADKVVPPEWVEHIPTEKQKEALSRLMGKQNGS